MRDYLYAIVDELPRGWRAPREGVAGAPVVARRVSGLHVVCSPLRDVPVAGPKNLAFHDDVVDSLMEAEAVLPVPYGFALPVADLASWMKAQRRALQAALAQVRGCVEITVTLLALGRGPGAPVESELKALGERLVAHAGVDQWRYRASRRGAGAASVAFLVARRQVPALLARIAPVASRAAGVAVVPTGPCPAYSFVPVLERLPLAHAPSTAGPARGRHAV